MQRSGEAEDRLGARLPELSVARADFPRPEIEIDGPRNRIALHVNKYSNVVGSRPSSEPIVYIDRSDIREGAIEELRSGVRWIVEFIDSREPQLITYGFYIGEDAGRMIVVAVHPDRHRWSSTWTSGARSSASSGTCSG
jgi:hypothetical protein